MRVGLPRVHMASPDAHRHVHTDALAALGGETVRMVQVDPHTVKSLYDALHRYAGWLDRERTSVMVRADVQALGTAIDTSADPMPLLEALDTSLARLPSGEVRKMLRTASKDIRRALAELR